ncbi:MAG: hypothetical protein IJE48_03785 [Clostridia bacterium]|nr:hypothetical protein [Clostridia bacterium]
MKKILAVLLAASMLFAFAACGGNDDEATTTAPVTEEEVVTDAPTDEATEAATDAPVDASEAATDAPADPSAADPSAVDASAAETTAVADKEMTQAEFVAFLNAETAKAAKGSYNFNRTCSYTDEIDVGDSTEALNKVIAMVDKNSNISTVVGGFLGIGTKKGAFPKDKPDEDYQLKATSLKEADLQNFSYADGVYSFTLANAANPKKTGATPLHRFTNDFITHEEVDESIKDTAKGLITLNSTNVDYTNIKVSVTVEGGKIVKMTYQYNFAATLQVKILVGNVDGDGAAITKGEYTNIKY